MAQKAALYRQLQKQKQEMQDKDFQDLIERGLNPYEIHRKKDMEAQVCMCVYMCVCVCACVFVCVCADYWHVYYMW